MAPTAKMDDTFRKNQLFDTKFVDSVLQNHNPSLLHMKDTESSRLQEYQHT